MLKKEIKERVEKQEQEALQDKFNEEGVSRSKSLRSPRASGGKISLYRKQSTRKTRHDKDIVTKKTNEAKKLSLIEEVEMD